MDKTRTLSAAAVIFIALTAGLFFISARNASDEHAQPATVHSNHHNDTTEADHTHALNDDTADHSMEDIYVYAASHLGTFHEIPESAGGTGDWTGWELHWVDVEHHGEIIRIYHAAAAHHHDVRFVTMWRWQDDHPAAWEAAH